MVVSLGPIKLNRNVRALSTFLAAMNKIQSAADKHGLAVLGFAMTREILERRLQLEWRAFNTTDSRCQCGKGPGKEARQ